MSKQIVFALVTFLHDLFTAVWIGGLLTLGLTVLPAVRQVRGRGPERKKLLSAIQRRLSTFVYVSIAGLVGTGLLMSRRSPAFQGFLNFGTPYATALSLKHLLVIAMVAVALVRSLGLRPTQDNVSPSRERLSGGLLLLNVVLGIAVLLLSGFTAAFAGTPPP